MQVLPIKIANNPDEAPNWSRDHLDVRGADITEAIVVGLGTETGKPTVDIIFEDRQGGKFVATLTGDLVKMLANVVANVESRTKE